jgi:hypothetical protein
VSMKFVKCSEPFQEPGCRNYSRRALQDDAASIQLCETHLGALLQYLSDHPTMRELGDAWEKTEEAQG